jgi:outer membrane biosynthesis protein TonB
MRKNRRQFALFGGTGLAQTQPEEFHEMNISNAAIGFLVGAGVAAGAGGAYMATRPSAPVAAIAGQSDPAVSTALAQGPVEQSEAIVAEEPVPVTQVVPASPRSAAKPAAAPVERRRPELPRPAPAPTPVAANVPEPARAPAPAPPVEVIEPPRIVDNQASRIVEPVGPQYDELVVAADSVIGLEIETAVSTERARVEDPVVAHVTRDVRVGNRVAIPAGARVNGEVTTVERGGRLKDRARLGVRFTSIVLADGTRVPIETETIYREGDSPVNESAAKIGGGAIGGAIIGGILGGGKGAAIGSIVGAGAGSGAVAAGGRNAATLPAGTPVTVRIHEPVAVTVER